MQNIPLIESILKYKKEKRITFSMPGHLGGRGFDTEYGKLLYSDPFSFDLTESEALDNLHNPKSSIKYALDKLRDYYKSYKSYFILNGTSSSNLIAGFSCFNENDEILIERNSHISIYNLIKLRKLKPIYIIRENHEKYGVYLSIDCKELKDKIDENPNIKGIFLTYPTYFGSVSDIQDVIVYAKSKGIYVIIDSAHGTHFGIHPLLPKHAVSLGADIVSMSPHKTIPSLGQTSFLHLNNKELEKKVDMYFRIFATTSPSYLMMGTMDYGRYFIEKDGYNYYNKTIKMCLDLKGQINNTLDKIKIIEDEKDFKIDPTRINIFSKFISGEEIAEFLFDQGIVGEMAVGNVYTLIMNPFNKKEEYEQLYLLLKSLDAKIKGESKEDIIKLPSISRKYFELYETIDKEHEYLELELSENKICGKSISIYPPGVPIIVEGEVYTKKIIEFIIENKNKDIHGLIDGKICTLKL